MYRVALNVAISYARDMKRAGARHFEPLDDSHLDSVAGPADRHEESMAREEHIATLHAFIAQLDPLHRAQKTGAICIAPAEVSQ